MSQSRTIDRDFNEAIVAYAEQIAQRTLQVNGYPNRYDAAEHQVVAETLDMYLEMATMALMRSPHSATQARRYRALNLGPVARPPAPRFPWYARFQFWRYAAPRSSPVAPSPAPGAGI